MKVLVSYVVQDTRVHAHHSEILEIPSPPYIVYANPPIGSVMTWVEKKQSTLSEGKKIVIISMYII